MDWAASLLNAGAAAAAGLEWQLVAENILKILVAFALAFPVGWERGKHYNAAGFRTFPIVAMGSCGYALIAQEMPDFNAESLSRVIQGLVAGVGFIGGGAVIKEVGTVQGVWTAASIWNTGAIGMAVAYDSFEIAITLATVKFLALLCLTPVSEEYKKRLGEPE